MKIKYYKLSVLLCVLVFWAMGCTNKEDALLSESANDRVDAAIAEYESILLTESPLWELNYQTKSGEEFDFLLRFKENNRVLMISDFSVEPVESSWKMTAEESIVLSFDTYSLLHILADPGLGGDKGKGYEGDFEFILNGFEDNQEVFMIGRKHKGEFSLKRVPETAIEAMHDAASIYNKLFDADARLFRVLVDANTNPIATLFFNVGTRTIDYYYTNLQGEFIRKNNIQVKAVGKTIQFKEDLLINDLTIASCEFIDENILKVDEEHSFIGSNIPSVYQEAYDKEFGNNAYMVASSAIVTNLLDEMKEIKPNIIGLQYYWVQSKDRPALTVTARGPKGNTIWYNMFGDPDQLKAGEDVVTYVFTGTYGWSGTGATREEAREIINMAQVKEIRRLINQDGKGASVIPAQAPRHFYLVSRANADVWILFKHFS